jgi:hypothetical protein
MFSALYRAIRPTRTARRWISANKRQARIKYANARHPAHNKGIVDKPRPDTRVRIPSKTGEGGSRRETYCIQRGSVEMG